VALGGTRELGGRRGENLEGSLFWGTYSNLAVIFLKKIRGKVEAHILIDHELLQ